MHRKLSLVATAMAALIAVVQPAHADGVKFQTNTVDPNAIDPNALDPNALDPNALDPNAVNPNALTSNGISPSALTAAPMGNRVVGIEFAAPPKAE